MDAGMRAMLFGTGPRLDSVAPSGARPKGSILGTFKGFGPDGAGREAGLQWMQRFGMIPSDGASSAGSAMRALSDGSGVPPADGAALLTESARADLATRNPIYDGLLARSLTQPDGVAVAQGVVSEVAPPVASEELAQRVAGNLDFIGSLDPADRLPALARAVDETAAAGLGDNAYTALARELVEHRPLEAAVGALESVARDVAPKAGTTVAETVDRSLSLLSRALRV